MEELRSRVASSSIIPDTSLITEVIPKNGRFFPSFSEYIISNYNLISNIDNSNGRGLAIFIKSGLNHNVEEDLRFGFQESLCLSLKNESANLLIVLI